MKKRITSLMLLLVVAVSMTMGASAASYIPDDVTYQNLNGQQLAIKTYTLLPDQDPSDLYEDDFEYDGFLYSMSDIVKEEQRYQEENAHTEVVTVTTASKNLEDKVASPNHLFYKGQIIYSKIRPLLRKAVIAPFDGLCSADMYPLNTAINRKYLLKYMLSDAFNLQVATAMSSRVKMPKINQDELSKILIPIPPMQEQERIVSKIEGLFDKITLI